MMTVYQTIEEIGRGGFGIVEEVEDKKSGKRFASKTLAYPPNCSKEDMQARFKREVKYQRTISHPNVVPIIDDCLTDDPPWFIMPLAEGSLLQELRDDRTLSGNPRKALFDLIAGLEEIHRVGYKHRDLSPGNVLRFRDSANDVYYAVSDFGLMSPQEGQTTTLTGTNVAGGTVSYRAPECAVDFKRATSLADIYSVGAILHDIFGTGGTRIPHTELWAPGAVGLVIAKCTKTNPRRRYKSVQELREALYEALDDGEIVFTSDEEKHYVEILRNNDQLTDQQWDELFSFLDRTSANNGSSKNVLSALRRDHVESLHKLAPELFHALGNEYAAFAQNYGFDFEFSDVVASILQIFYDNGEIDLKANIALAMLELGVSHNRWAVERKFLRMVSPEISDELASRIAVEAEVRQISLEHQLARIRSSLGITELSVHTKIFNEDE